MEWSPNVNGKATAGLVTGISALGVTLLNGGLGNLFGGMVGGRANNGNDGGCNCSHIAPIALCSENMPVDRYDLSKENEIVQLKMEKALLESNIYTDTKIADVYERLSNKIAVLEASNNCRLGSIESQIATQAVWNASQTGIINCLQSQVAESLTLTKRVIPASSVCPTPMAQYNSWTAPTAPTTGA
jgi:hypothetical protein